MTVALRFKVVDTEGDQRLLDAVFDRFPVRLGRNQINDLCIARPFVSRLHATVELCDGRIVVRDLGSLTGTSVLGGRLTPNEPVDVTASPEIRIGHVVVQMAIVAAPPRDDGLTTMTGVRGRRAPGREDPLVRQMGPYLEACRVAWHTACRMIQEHLTQLPPELRTDYLDRLAAECPSIVLEPEFQRLARRHGVDPGALGEPTPAATALAAFAGLVRALVPSSHPPEEVADIVALAQRLRDTLELFFKCFCGLRDGYQEFLIGVLDMDRQSLGDTPVARARDAQELGAALLGADAAPEATRQVSDLLVNVMNHQVALLRGVGEGIRTLLNELSPKVLEEELDAENGRRRLFSNRHEELWKLYARRHGNYAEDDKQMWQIVFGRKFSDGYKRSG
jgi:type VI secretion system protein ImpI